MNGLTDVCSFKNNPTAKKWKLHRSACALHSQPRSITRYHSEYLDCDESSVEFETRFFIKLVFHTLTNKKLFSSFPLVAKYPVREV